jgi:hypothetical protein
MSRRDGFALVALLGGTEREMWSVVDRAVELAHAKHGSLTLAAGPEREPLRTWLTGARSRRRAAGEQRLRPDDRLARAAEFVPAAIPLATRRLEAGGAGAVRELTRDGAYDLLVIGHTPVAHSRRLRRQLRQTRVSVLIACPQAIPDAERLRRRARGERATETF